MNPTLNNDRMRRWLPLVALGSIVVIASLLSAPSSSNEMPPYPSAPPAWTTAPPPMTRPQRAPLVQNPPVESFTFARSAIGPEFGSNVPPMPSSPTFSPPPPAPSAQLVPPMPQVPSFSPPAPGFPVNAMPEPASAAGVWSAPIQESTGAQFVLDPPPFGSTAPTASAGFDRAMDPAVATSPTVAMDPAVAPDPQAAVASQRRARAVKMLPFQEGHWQGIEVVPLTPRLAASLQIAPDVRGVIMDDVSMPADVQGFIAGDVVTAVEGAPTPNLDSFIKAADLVRDRSQVQLEIVREGQVRNMTLRGLRGRLGNANGETAPMIPPGARMPHEFRGACTNCHRIGTRGNLAKDNGDMITMVAPVIQAGQRRPHMDRGPCPVCHTILPR